MSNHLTKARELIDQAAQYESLKPTRPDTVIEILERARKEYHAALIEIRRDLEFLDQHIKGLTR